MVGPYDFRPPFYCNEACADRLSKRLGDGPSGGGGFGFLHPALFPAAPPIGTSTLMVEKIPDSPPSPYYTFRPWWGHPVFTLGPDAPAWPRELISQEFGARLS